MDAKQFDTLARSLTNRRSRRGALAAVVGGALGVASLAETDAKKKKPCPPCKTRKKGKCKKKLPDGAACAGGTCQGGSCVAAPTCTDGIKNGSETGVDCGGPDCPPCANGKTCTSRNDCASAVCSGTCQTCTPGTPCAANSQCFCAGGSGTGDPVCIVPGVSNAFPGSCPDSCPSDMACLTLGGGQVGCATRCTAP